MQKEKFAWLISVGLVALLAFQLPGSMAQRDDDYSFVRTLVDIHRQVMQNYVEPPDDETLRQAAIDGMLGQLDPFTMYVPPAQQEAFDRMLEGSFRGVGIQLNQQKEGAPIEVVSPIEGSPAFKAGILPGDQILKVNGESVEGERLPDVIKRITGQVGTDVTLTVRHADGEEEDIVVTRQEIQVPTIMGYERRANNDWDWYIADEPQIAYLRLTQFTPDSYERLRGIIERLLRDGMDGMILDLRYNPGGRLDEAIEIVDMFIEEGTIVSTRGRNRPEQVVRATSAGTLPRFPMIVLVNEGSASAAEVVAGSLMDNRRALVIGEQTFGKGSVQELIKLDGNGGELKLTVAYYYLPSGRLVHRKEDAPEGGDWGVMPHIVVEMDDDAERAAVEARAAQEQFRVPMPKATTQPSTGPTTQPVDAQLQRAVDTMIALLVFDTGGNGEGRMPVPPHEPPPHARQDAAPATQPASPAEPAVDTEQPEPAPAAEPAPDAPDAAAEPEREMAPVNEVPEIEGIKPDAPLPTQEELRENTPAEEQELAPAE